MSISVLHIVRLFSSKAGLKYLNISLLNFRLVTWLKIYTWEGNVWFSIIFNIHREQFSAFDRNVQPPGQVVYFETLIITHAHFLSGSMSMFRKVQPGLIQGLSWLRDEDYKVSPSYSCLGMWKSGATSTGKPRSHCR